MSIDQIAEILAEEAESLLTHTCNKIPNDLITMPNGDHATRIFSQSDRSEAVTANLHRLYNHGNLSGTGYLSIFPVDQGMEHTAAYSFYSNPLYFDPENILKMAVEGGCNAVASTLGVLGLVSKKYADKIPFIVKVNHSEHLTNPALTNQVLFSSAEQAANMGAAGVGATIYFGSNESHRQIEEISALFADAHKRGLFTILWCYPRNDTYERDGIDYASSVDITSQAIHIGVSLGADIIKQKLPESSRGFSSLNFSKYSPEMYEALLTDNPIDLVRYQVAHSYMGKISMINSGGEASGENDLKSAVRSAVINKRGGGAGLIMGRKVFKKPFSEGLEILRAVQGVYASSEITVA
ncbi:MAG: class I fructose-bisphosphate aldolase [Microgenomates group bacterium]